MTKKIENKLSKEDEQKFDEILKLVLECEGGKSNNPNDSGGKTNRGITQRTYNQFCQDYQLKQKDVFDLSMEETKLFYRTMYQNSNSQYINDPQLAYVYFDAVVNCGPTGGAKHLQRAIEGINVDGKVGKNTLSKANSMDPKKLAQKVLERRRNFYAQIVAKNPSQKVFEKGWNNRLNKIQDVVNRGAISQKLQSQSTRPTSASSNASQYSQNLKGIDCNPDISKLNRIRGINGKNGKFLLADQENIILTDLITVLSVYNDEKIQPEHKHISFSLDPISEKNQPTFQFQEKVCWPDKYVNRSVIQDSEFAKVMFESDYLLKLMSLGIQSDGKTQFQYPYQLSQLGLKPCHEFENKNEERQNQHQMFRFWLVPEKCTFSRKNDSYIINDIKVACQARQVEMVNNKLQDMVLQDEKSMAYRFAQKFTQIYDQVAQHYPIFNRLKQAFKAVALGKWMYQNQVNLDFQKMMSLNKKVNNNPKAIPIIKVERLGEKIQTPIYFTQQEKIQYAKDYLKEKGHQETSDLIKQIVEQISDIKGYSVEQSCRYSKGGIDPNCKKLEETNWPAPKQNEDEFEEIEIPFLPQPKCKECPRIIETKLVNHKQDACSIHNKYTCLVCLELITQDEAAPKGIKLDGVQYGLHNQCYEEYQKMNQSTVEDDFF